MKRPRDMTRPQFDAACERAGFKPAGFMGYYVLPLPGVGRHSVSIWNAGKRRRDQLAYLHARLKAALAEL